MHVQLPNDNGTGFLPFSNTPGRVLLRLCEILRRTEFLRMIAEVDLICIIGLSIVILVTSLTTRSRSLLEASSKPEHRKYDTQCVK